MVNFEEVWDRIRDHAGEEFRQIRGGTNQNLPRSHFERASRTCTARRYHALCSI